MTVTRRRIVVLLLAALMLAAAVFAGISTSSSVHDANAVIDSKSGGVVA